jgi:hypothetical protein
MLLQALDQNPQDDTAWLWLGGITEDPRTASECLKLALQCNPKNTAARTGLRELEAAELGSSGAEGQQG